jgi:hypothetical protein
LRRFIARLGKTGQLPFRRLECEPAGEAQVDFGSGAPVATAEGRLRKSEGLATSANYFWQQFTDFVVELIL